jgi:Tfp pilus assembly protein PilN
MNVINFLPNDYLAKRNRRRANWVCVAIAATVLIIVGSSMAFIYVNSANAARLRGMVEQQYQEASLQLNQLQQLEERKADLLRKVSLSTTLLERVPRSTVLARLTNHLPRGTSMTSLTMKMEEVEVRASEITGEAAKGVATKAAKAATVRVKQYVFRLDGVAPTDVEVAEYITRLNADPLFRGVDLQFSEELTAKDGTPQRRFELMFRLSSNAEKVLEKLPAPAGETAQASPVEPARGDS